MKVKAIIDSILEDGIDSTIEIIVGSYIHSCNETITGEKKKSIRISVMRLFNKYKHLNKSASREKGQTALQEFFVKEYSLPEVKPHAAKRSLRTTDDAATRSTLKGVATCLASELYEAKLDKEKAEEQLSCTSQELVNMKKSQSRCILKATQNLERKLEKQKETSNDLKKGVKRALAREEYYRCKVAKLQKDCPKVVSLYTQANICDVANHTALEKELSETKRKNAELTASCEWLETLLNDADQTILYDSQEGAYNADCQKCVYDLLDLGVSASKVGPVIDRVLKLAGKPCDRVPSKSTVLTMNIQRLHLAQEHIGEVLAEKEHLALMTDETSRRGTKYMGYEARDADAKLWVLGVREIATKSATDTLNVFQEILKDIDLACKSATTERSRLLLQHVVATMSDRASTEVKFNTLLQEFKENVMPGIHPNFSSLSENERHSLCRLANFFCGLHALIHFAETSEHALMEVEKDLLPDNPQTDEAKERVSKKNESATTRLIRTASKAFAAGADEKSGVYGQFMVYMRPFLKEHNMYCLPLQPFRGSRFNILFDNAAGTFFLHTRMLNFLREMGADNLLTKAVLCDLQKAELQAGCKALGLIGYLVTKPLWSLLEDKQVHILDMNRKYTELVEFFTEATQRTEDFMLGKLKPFGDETHIQMDDIYACLLSESPHDGTTEAYLKVIFPALAVLSRRLFKDHLEGGIHSTATDDQGLRKKLACVPKSNKYAESVFGLLDHLITRKPNVSTLACEAHIMFSQNKTMDWLGAKCVSEQEKLLKDARCSTERLRSEFRRRKEEIESRKKEALRNKITQRHQAEARKLQRKENVTSDIIGFGLWQSKMEVENQVKSLLTTKEKIEALKAQLRFRKSVLYQKPPTPLVYTFTKVVGKKRVTLSVSELMKNVQSLVEAAQTTTVSNTSTLVHRRVKHRFLESDGNVTWYPGKVISQV